MKKPKVNPIIIHNERELLAWLDNQIFDSHPNPRLFRFSKEMIEASQFKIIKQNKKERKQQ